MDRGPWWAIVYGVTKSQTRLSDSLFHLSVFSLTIPKFTAWNYFYIEVFFPQYFFLKRVWKMLYKIPIIGPSYIKYLLSILYNPNTPYVQNL